MKDYLLSNMKPLFLFAASFLAGVQKYLFDDVEYLKWLIVAVSIDLITGIAKVWLKEGYKAVTSKGVRMTVTKFIQYGGFLIITHVLANFTVNGAKASPFAFVKDWGYILLLLIEVKSVYENLVAIDNRMDFIKPLIRSLTKQINTSKKEVNPDEEAK
jgi:uncharacterized protein YacL